MDNTLLEGIHPISMIFSGSTSAGAAQETDVTASLSAGDHVLIYSASAAGPHTMWNTVAGVSKTDGAAGVAQNIITMSLSGSITAFPGFNSTKKGVFSILKGLKRENDS